MYYAEVYPLFTPRSQIVKSRKTHLMECVFESKHRAQILFVDLHFCEQRNEEISLYGATLKAFQHEVAHTIWIQVELT